jgi:hypothetical protein
LGGALDGLAQEVLGVVKDLGFDVAEVLIGGVEEADDRGFQSDGQASGHHGQGFWGAQAGASASWLDWWHPWQARWWRAVAAEAAVPSG